jgi:hypothetical protein
MGPVFILLAPPHLQVSLEFFEMRVTPFAKHNPIALSEHGLMQALADPIGLRTLDLRARRVNVLHRSVHLVFMALGTAAICRAPVR